MTPLTVEQRFTAASAQLPLVAILRGITPGESVAIGRRLYEAGFRLIEVPLNSPEPFKSIAAIRQSLTDDVLVGAGTVLNVDQVRELKQLQEENSKLKRLVAELSLDKAVLQDVLSKKFPGPR